MVKSRTVISLGWENEWEEEEVHTKINKLINNYALRIKMSKSGQELVNGKGSQKVSEIILREFREKR